MSWGCDNIFHYQIIVPQASPESLPSSASTSDSSSFYLLLQQAGHSEHRDIDRSGNSSLVFPSSNAISQADREYFNMIKTEDGSSLFVKTEDDEKDVDDDEAVDEEKDIDEYINPKVYSIPCFSHHKVLAEDGTSVVGIYLTGEINDEMDDDNDDDDNG